MRRRLASVGREILELASQETGELEALLDEAERKVFHLAEKKREGDLRPVRELMEHTLDLLDKMKSVVQRHHRPVHRLRRPRPAAHRACTRGELIILAARPGIGKTSLAMNIAMHVALQGEARPVGIFSPGNARGSAADAPARHRRARGHEEAARRPAHAARRGEVPGGRRASCTTRRSTSTTPAACPRSTCAPRRGGSSRRTPRLGLHRHRLPPADAPEGQGREPPARGLRDQPRAQAAGQGAGGADHRALPAQP